MRYDREHKHRTRARIVDAAAAVLCREGPDAVTLHQVMRDAGLSHGGFYAHFASRDAMLGAALDAAAARTLAALFDGSDASSDIRTVVARYLGRAHLDPDGGCPLPAATGADLEDAVAVHRRRIIAGYRDRLTQHTGDAGRANALLALMVGGVALARALGGEDGETVLRDCRQAARAIAP